MTDLRQTKEYGKYMKALGWQALKLNDELRSMNYAYVKKIPLLGNIAKIQRPSDKIEIKEIRSFVEKNKIAVLYLEPVLHSSYYMSHGFSPAKTCFLPSKTIHLDLLQSNKVLLSQMNKDTRYAIRVAQKRGVIVKESQDISKACLSIEVFIKLWTHSARSRGMWLPQTKEIRALWKAFGTKTHILLALADSFDQHVRYKSVTAGVFMVRTLTTAYYMYAASTKEGNRLCAPSLLVWEAIKLAKKKGCKIFDFEGIYDERYPQTKNWKGFTKFKEAFGGKIVEYPKTLVKYYNSILKLIHV